MIRWVVLVALILACAGGLYYWRSRPTPTLDLREFLDRRVSVDGTPLAPEWVGRVRALSEITPDLAREMGSALLDADAAESTGTMVDVDGDGSRDVVLKRYWTGTGVAFDLLIILNCRTQPIGYLFSGGERGGACSAEVLDVRNDGHKVVVVPKVLIDRGADTVLNWPTLYAFHKGSFVIVDRQYRSFYEELILPKLPITNKDPQAGDVRALREQVGRLYP